jgi:transglutaminase-like putative cysteine protease
VRAARLPERAPDPPPVRVPPMRDKWFAPFTLVEKRAFPARSARTLVFLLGSRYCDTEKFSQTAWSLFGQTPSGWGRVQAICDFVHNHISFGYEHCRAFP